MARELRAGLKNDNCLSDALYLKRFWQLGRFFDHLVWDQRVGGSNPLAPTILHEIVCNPLVTLRIS